MLSVINLLCFLSGGKSQMIDLSQIVKQTETLSGDEQLALAMLLIERVRRTAIATAPQHRWLDMIGAAPYPLVGEDAQAWVTRTRSEDEAERESQWRPTP
jgi:hypothetical protein